MNLSKKIARILPILLIILWSCQTENDVIPEEDTREQEVESFISDAEIRDIDSHARKGVDIDPSTLVTCNEKSYPIIAWWNREVGSVKVSNDNEYLVAEFSSEEYFFKYTKLLIMVETTKTWGNRTYSYYKKYLYRARHRETTQDYAYVIPLEDLNLNEDSKITFAAMAWLSDSPGYSRRKLFGLAEDTENHSKRFWQKWLIDYQIEECIVNTCVPDGIPIFAEGVGETFSDFGINDWTLEGYVFTITTGDNFAADLKIDGMVIGGMSVFTKATATQYIVNFNLDEGYKLLKARIYLSADPPVTGIPCDDSYLESTSNEIFIDKPTSSEFYLIAYIEVEEEAI